MFKVLMIACNVFGQCVGIGDDFGPNETMDACEARRAELIAFLHEHPLWPVPFEVRSKCGAVEPDGVAL